MSPRLTQLKPLLPKLGGTVQMMPRTEQDRNRLRNETLEWRKWYGTQRWKNLRWSILVRDKFTCQMPECGKMEIDTSQLVADHITAHRGDARLFWEPSNLRCICKPCHDSVKQSAEKNEQMF